MKKLLFVINTLSAAGAEMSFLELLRQIDQTQYEIELLVLLGQGELRDRLPSGVRLVNTVYSDSSVLSDDGRRVLKKTVLRAAFHRGAGIRLSPYLLRTLLAMCRRGQVQMDKLLWQLIAQGAQTLTKTYDLAVAYLEGGSAYYVAKRVHARKKVAFFHSDYEKSGYTRAIDRACYVGFDRIYTVSQEGRQTFLKVYPELAARTWLFHNPLDQNRLLAMSLAAVDMPQWADYDGKKLLSVGRLVPLKGFDLAVTVMYLLKQQGIRLRWYVLGEGAQREHLEQLIARYGLQDDFFLLGAVENPYCYYAGCDLYVHLSYYEGRSVAIQEAQALGCAVLASDCSGNREQITDGMDGVLVTYEPEQIQAKIVGLLADEKRRKQLGKAASQKPTSYPQETEQLLALAGQP